MASMLNVLLVPCRIIIVSAVLVLAACATSPVVKTPEQAIAIGWKACDGSWGQLSRQNGLIFKFRPEMWHARLTGDHWKVWAGDEGNPGMHIDVRTDGRPPDGATECYNTLSD
jgi:hypothetical protein